MLQISEYNNARYYPEITEMFISGFLYIMGDLSEKHYIALCNERALKLCIQGSFLCKGKVWSRSVYLCKRKIKAGIFDAKTGGMEVYGRETIYAG